MKILFLESFYGGSHRDFADSFARDSHHDITLVTLPARHWKWRQSGSALAFCDEIDRRGVKFTDYDGILLTGLSDLNLLKSLRTLPPVLLYLHESQFHYPLGEGEKQDYHFGFKDFTNMLAADEIIFNSLYHGETFMEESRRFLKMMPDHTPMGLWEKLNGKWDYVYPGFSPCPYGNREKRSGPPAILWNHRWEHDKNPDDFLSFLRRLAGMGFSFRLILLGERFRNYPAAFDIIGKEFRHNIIHSGFLASREEYWDLLHLSDYAVSTSRQENFGISVVEAIWAGALPLLPRRLSYPELLEDDYRCYLYADENELLSRFISLESHPPEEGEGHALRLSMGRFSRSEIIPALDQILQNMSS
jgi:glycosyltransferase involved in cell wall biosynthesis